MPGSMPDPFSLGGNRVGGFLAVSPSHTTGHAYRIRRFPSDRNSRYLFRKRRKPCPFQRHLRNGIVRSGLREIARQGFPYPTGIGVFWLIQQIWARGQYRSAWCLSRRIRWANNGISAPMARSIPAWGMAPGTGQAISTGLKARFIIGHGHVARHPPSDESGFQPSHVPARIFLGLRPRLG